MKISDIIALAKSGYKVTEIKELMALGEPDVVEEPAVIPAKEPEQPEPEKSDPEPVAKTEESPDADKIKGLEAEIEKLKNDLAKAQQQNAARDLNDQTNTLSPQDTVNDIMKSLY